MWDWDIQIVPKAKTMKKERWDESLELKISERYGIISKSNGEEAAAGNVGRKQENRLLEKHRVLIVARVN